MNGTSAIRAALDKPFTIMGIVNVTPDSFYDGGRYSTTERAIEHALRLAGEGADVLDIGGASSRPGAEPVPVEIERGRVVPVIERVAREFSGTISVDTTWSEVAGAGLDAGAGWVNDISAGRFDPAMAGLVARRGCRIVLMHSRGTPQTMQQDPRYGDVVSEVRKELLDCVGKFKRAGTGDEQIILDPGIGFAKNFAHNLELLRGVDRLVATGYPVLVGTSRKSFIGHITGHAVEERLSGSLATLASAFTRGATIFRVHDVAQSVDFLKVYAAIERRPASLDTHGVG